MESISQIISEYVIQQRDNTNILLIYCNCKNILWLLSLYGYRTQKREAWLFLGDRGQAGGQIISSILLQRYGSNAQKELPRPM